MSRLRGSRSVTSRSPMKIVPSDDLLDPGDQLQQRRLAAAGRADEHHELAVADLERDVVDRGRAAALVGLAHRVDADAQLRPPTRSRPSTKTCRISSRSSSTTTSAGAPGGEPAEVGPLRHPRGHLARRTQRVLEPHAELHAGCARRRSSSARCRPAGPRGRARRRPRPRSAARRARTRRRPSRRRARRR